MRRLAIVGSISTGLVAIAACATSEESRRTSTEPEPSIVDASAQDVALASDGANGERRAPLCNTDGWCETILPDADLVLKDIWPLPDRAFAVADSYNSGIKVLEWTSADSTWRYIDDNSQNEAALADFAVKIWSPSVDEVYYAVSPGTIFHGRRPVPPATAWSWSSYRLEDNNPRKLDSSWFRARALGVWGTDSNNVYAWYSNTVFRRESRSDGGIEWVVEYIADDFDTPDEQLLVTGIAGTQANDLWFAGSRRGSHGAPCAIVVRKTPDGHHRIADGVVSAGYYEPCMARAGTPLLLEGVKELPAQFQSSDGHRFFFVNPWNEVVQIAPEGGGYSVRSARVPERTLSAVSSFWGESADHLWLVGTFATNGYGVAMTGTGIWGDGGTYQLSSTAHNGAPSTPANQIRGTSATNIWIVGARYAIHKTTP